MNSILIAYATMTGNTSTVAEAMVEHLGSKHTNLQTKLIDMAELPPKDILSYDLVVLGSSTWDDGDVNQVAREFLLKLHQDCSDLSGHKFAIFALGDNFYPEFCKAADVLEKNIAELGGQVIGEALKLDGFPDDDTLQSANNWLDTIISEAGK